MVAGLEAWRHRCTTMCLFAYVVGTRLQFAPPTHLPALWTCLAVSQAGSTGQSLMPGITAEPSGASPANVRDPRLADFSDVTIV